jgi:hypothetical protein
MCCILDDAIVHLFDPVASDGFAARAKPVTTKLNVSRITSNLAGMVWRT